MRNLEQVRKSQPIFKPNMPGETHLEKKSIDIETGNQPLMKSINEYIKHVSSQDLKEEMENSLVVNKMAYSNEKKLPILNIGGSFEDFKEIIKNE